MDDSRAVYEGEGSQQACCEKLCNLSVTDFPIYSVNCEKLGLSCLYNSNLDWAIKEIDASYLAFGFGESVIPSAAPVSESGACEDSDVFITQSPHRATQCPIESNTLV